MSRARLPLTFAALAAVLLAYGCGPSRYPSAQRAHAPESCADAAALPACEARIETLRAALADTLGAAPTVPPAPPDTEAVSEEAVQASAPPSHQSFTQQARRADAPDCTAARDLRDRICELSDAICGLAARDGAPREIMDRCNAARTNCERARTQVANACPP